MCAGGRSGSAGWETLELTSWSWGFPSASPSFSEGQGKGVGKSTVSSAARKQSWEKGSRKEAAILGCVRLCHGCSPGSPSTTTGREAVPAGTCPLGVLNSQRPSPEPSPVGCDPQQALAALSPGRKAAGTDLLLLSSAPRWPWVLYPQLQLRFQPTAGNRHSTDPPLLPKPPCTPRWMFRVFI